MHRSKNLDVWVRLALAAIIVQAVKDLFLVPLLFSLTGYESADTIRIGVVSDSARVKGIILIATSYASILVGIYAAKLFFFNGNMMVALDGIPRGSYYSGYPVRILRRGYVYSGIVYFIGIFAHVYILMSLMATMSIFDIAASRALFSSDLSTESALFMYAKLLSSFALVGTLGLVSFSRNSVELKRGFIALILLLSITVLYGGRAMLVLTFILFVLNYHLTVRPLSLRVVIISVMVVVGIFIVVSLLRFSVLSLSMYETVLEGLSSLGASRIEQTAWVQSVFPSMISYLGYMVPANMLAKLIPGLYIDDSTTLYMSVLDFYYGGVNYMGGIGGENYSNAAEFHSWGGHLAVIVFSILSGVFYGSIFRWASNNMHNLLIQIFTSVVFVFAFFPGVESKLIANVGDIGYYLLPLGFLSAGILGARKAGHYYAVVFLFIIFMAAWKLAGMGVFKYMAIFLFPIIYYFSYRMTYEVGVKVMRAHRPGAPYFIAQHATDSTVKRN